MTKLVLLIRGAALLLCLLIFQVASTSHGQASVSGACISSERDALLSFKASLLDPAGHLSSWQGEDCCRWKGVRCSNRTGHLIKLNLRNIDMDDYSYHMYDVGYYIYYMGDYSYPSRSRSLSLSAGEMSSSLATLQHLRYLDLSWNDFNDTSIPVFLASLKNLRLFGGLPEWLPGKIPQLKILRVRSNMFSGHIPKSFTSLRHLHYLDIAHNNMSGSIPWSLSNLNAMMAVVSHGTNDYFHEESIPVIMKDQKRDYTFAIYKLLVILDLSNNNLAGPVPEEITLLIGLTNLNLSNNQLTGAIPNQIGDLRQLDSLDLSFNEFSGTIPSSLSALTYLSHLNLSYNNLSGAIPSGQQLQALDNQMYIYIGNPGLCGGPVGKNCSTHDVQQSGLEDINHMSSVYLAMSMGFVVGLWTVFCTMLMKRTWRDAFFQFIDMIYDMVYVQVAIRWAHMMEKTQDGAP